ncbi:MAG TPA: hypothetical protein VGJ33_15185 [Candidatus Angelobacter sp.]|jgi:hypothetical protein
MSLYTYTVVLNYKGGTYISQVVAESPKAAIRKWFTGISDPDLAAWEVTNEKLSELSDDEPLPLDNCLNVWCASSSGKHGLLLLNIITTQTQ